MIDVKSVLEGKFPNFFKSYPAFLTNFCVFVLRKIVHEKEFNDFLEKFKDLEGIELVEAALETLNFDYRVGNKAKENIPSTGKLIIISNHPLGALDAFALIKLVREVRSDVKIVVNDLLMAFEPFKNIFLEVDITTRSSFARDIKKILEALKHDEAVIIFPAGEVSRARPIGIRDGVWESGFLYLSEKTGAPVLPIFTKAKNSIFFYTVSMIYKPLATLLLPDEMFKKRGKSLEFRIGEVIPSKNLVQTKLPKEMKIKLVKRHLYIIGRGKRGLFETEKNVAHPEDRKAIRDELAGCEVLGDTTDGKKIYLYDYKKRSVVLREIGRLREATFRKVGEGTGAKRDVDEYDKYYRHIVLWDDKELEIVGAYRIGEGKQIFDIFGVRGFYSYSLFRFGKNFERFLPHSIELGRSFVQPKYWGSRALDYLWQGIGAYLKRNPLVKYMFGPVSISNSYPDEAKKMLVYFYSKYFGSEEVFVESPNKFLLTKNEVEEMEAIFCSNDYFEDFRVLKEQLRNFNTIVPVLYKQYTELCEEGGVKFLDFGVDRDFGDCIDGFILVEVEKVLEAKKQRYIDRVGL